MNKKNISNILLCISLLAGLASCSPSLDKFTLNSPDGKVNLQISVVDSSLSYHLNWNEQEMVGLSDLALFQESDITVLNSQIVKHDSTWNTVWGQYSSIRDNYEELVLDIVYNNVKGTFFARAYDEGVAFRFILDEGEKPEQAVFNCSYALPSESQFYAPNGEKTPWGPLNLFGLREHQLGSSKNKKNSNIHMPVVVETPNHSFMALLESDLYAADGFRTMRISANLEQGKVESINKVKLSNKEMVTPWRVILVAESAGDLVTNTMVNNLATPCKIVDADWIKPGVCMWDFRVHDFTAPDGFVYGRDTESYLRFIDFAAENSIKYFLIDGGWYTGNANGEFNVNEDLDLSELMNYAEDKEVDVILYYDRKKGDFGDDKLFTYYQSLGGKGIKYGFMGNNPNFSREAIKRSTESKMLIDFHDSPVPFAGISRTYPNAITREYCHAQQDCRKAFTPETFIKMALINGITGPLDMTNGCFDLNGINSGMRERGPLKNNSFYSTVTSETARTLIIFSGLVCIPDAPEAYDAKKDLFEFIRKQPVGKWDESRILNSKMGEYITTARRHGKEWFIGSVIDQNGGTLDINLDFLDADQEYAITYYEDTKDTHCKTNTEAYQVRKGTIKKGEVVKAVLAPGGGHCMWIRPIEQ